jgi:Ca2+-binding EF-hand superfamily protein
MQENGFDLGAYSDLWYRYDLNEDGRIDREEFIRMFSEKF